MLKRSFILSMTLVPWGLYPVAAQQTAPASKVQNVPNSYLVYQKCRSTALKSFAKPEQRPRLLKALSECKKQTPQAYEYDQCKKQALSNFGKDLKRARAEVLACREVMEAKSFAGRDEIPLKRVEEKLFFAGVDLNKKLKVSDIRAETPGFDCTVLRETLNGEREPDYLLFGNRPDSFAQADNKDVVKAFYDLLKKEKVREANSKDPYKYINRMGRVYKTEKRAALFFPKASCTYMKRKGRFYEGLKIYYLVDLGEKEAWPFFGLSFYRRTKKIADQEFINAELKRELGQTFRDFATQRGAIYLVEDEINEFDDEDDPFDICKAPRRHKIIAVIKERKPKNQGSMLMVVANIRNLCQFGDERFAKWRAPINANKKANKKTKP